MPRYEEEGKQDTQARFKITDVALDKSLLRHKLWETKKNFPSEQYSMITVDDVVIKI